MKRIISLLLTVLLLFSTAAFAEADEWACPDCGASNTTAFCTKCGAKRSEEIVCPNCGAKYPLDSGVAFCGDCGTKLQQSAGFTGRYEGEGFATPEEALTFYMEGYKNLDFNQILGAFAWETQMEHYSVLTHLERIRAYNSAMRPRMPSTNTFLYTANLNSLRSYQVDMICRSIEEYVLGEDSPTKSKTGSISFEKDTDQVAEFLKKFENGRLEKLTQMTNIRFLTPDDVTDNKFSLEINQKNFIKQTACYGADETVNIIGVADVGDETFYCCPTICRYGDRWYLVSVSSYTSMIIGAPNQYQAFVCGEGSFAELVR